MNRRSALPALCAAFMLVAGFLPVANWLAGGHEAEWYGTLVTEWTNGAAIGVGLGVVLMVVLRRYGFWPAEPFRRLAVGASERPGLTAVALTLLALAIYAVVALQVLSGRPLLIDEIVQVMQARIFAEGRLTLPVADHPEFFSALNVVDVGDRVFSQFPLGGPLMLLPGVLAGATWITGPVFGAVAVGAFWLLSRRTETSPGRALGAALLLAMSPFMVFMSGSHMNHVPTLAWLVLALVLLHRLTSGANRQALLAFACGFCLGMMTAIRPVDGASFALPAGLWMLYRTVRSEMRWGPLLLAGLGVALPTIAVLAFNHVSTGSATLFGYELLWGPSHGLGFHRAPWGVSHTPARGLELLNLMFLRLQAYVFETPVPSLVPAIVALGLTRSLSAFDRYLLVSSGLLMAGYFAYWHDGFFLGPRFAFLLLPVIVTWTVRFPSIIQTRFPSAPWVSRTVVLVYLVSAAVALSFSIPTRAGQYTSGLLSMRQDYLAPAADAGVRNAVILVRESWGAQLIARLWGLGVPRSETEGIYRTVDTCLLENAVSRLEQRDVRGDAALQALLPLTADSARLVESELSPDATERVLPGATYGPVCRQRILEDRGGYSFFTPILARERDSNVYARDLHGRDRLLLSRYPERPVYLLRRQSSRDGAPLLLEPLNVDSARSAWAAAAPSSP